MESKSNSVKGKKSDPHTSKASKCKRPTASEYKMLYQMFIILQQENAKLKMDNFSLKECMESWRRQVKDWKMMYDRLIDHPDLAFGLNKAKMKELSNENPLRVIR